MKEINTQDFENEVLKGGKVVLDFYSTECPPCEALAPKFEALAELYGEKIKFLKIFRQGNRELATSLGVNSSPTLLFFDNGKQILDTISGGIKKAEIIERLDKMISEEEAAAIKANQKSSVSEYDVAILGGGPAGLTAGIYLGQAKIKTLLIDPSLPGGYMGTTHQVSNYPGFEQPQPGFMLAHFMSEQAKHTGIDYKVAVDVTSVDLQKKEIIIDELETIKAKKIIIATGTTPNTMNAPGEVELKGKGISYCATCDAKYFDDKDVVVIGGGNSAVEESLFITKFAKKITMIHQFDKLTANQTAVEELQKNDKISVMYEYEPRKFEKRGDKMITVVENLKTKELSELESDGVFVFIGFKANVSTLGNTLPELDKWGYIKTNEDMQTSISDVYAVGDIISKKYRQITTAVADGTIAAMTISKELD
ncbi:Thioredoxin reductase [uncultured Paludibacter sp.]|uniref:Thioredoxin reductase n=1 Tax=uncultured Paludibacter sp. TaxID=497635 RepID=A0A653A6V2_9BACT|nr:Thioredoxin reductase [uncultured Paludibacter sp.]